MEVTQFTYFQQVGGLDCRPVTGEITYGLERLAMYLQGVESIFDIVWADGPLGRVTYRDVYHQNEVEQSKYNFELADTAVLLRRFDEHEAEFTRLIEAKLALPAYEQVMKASHTFNLLDARKAISVTERQRYILRVRTMARAVAQAYYDSREALGFPMLRKKQGRPGMNSAARDFLVELGTEELPPLALPELERAFAEGIRAGLDEAAPAARRIALVRHAAPPRRAGARSRRRAARAGHQAQGPAGQRRLRQGRRAHGRGAPSSRRNAASRWARSTRVTEGKGEFLYLRRQQARASYREPAAGHRAALARRAADPEAHALGRVDRRVRAAGALAGACCSARELVPARILDTDAGTRHARPSVHGAAGTSRSRSPRTTKRRCASAAR